MRQIHFPSTQSAALVTVAVIWSSVVVDAVGAVNVFVYLVDEREHGAMAESYRKEKKDGATERNPGRHLSFTQWFEVLFFFSFVFFSFVFLFLFLVSLS